MEGAVPDSGAFRDAQEAQWNAAAGGWRKWSKLIDQAAGEISERLVELAEIETGSRVLDVACGYGEPALTAAAKAGDEGSVVATDISEQMLGFGRERAADAGLANIVFVRSAAASLDFSPDSFDAALSRFGIIFDPDGEEAAAKVRELLGDGGKFAIASWATPDRVPFIAVPMMTTVRCLGIEPPPPGLPGPLSRPTPAALGGLLEGGGFAEIEVEDARVKMQWDSAEEFATFVRETVPPITALLADHPEEVQAGVWEAITDAVRAHASGSGEVAMEGVALLAVGTA